MTVCIAAMCGPGTIFGAADRMKTAGDVQFEPPSAKIIGITTSIAIMTAGDAAFQAEILQEIENVVNERIRREPLNWWRVKDVADLYAYYRNFIRQKRAENTILTPLGLDKNTFIQKQAEMSQEFISQITSELLNFSVPDVAAIITGSDLEGTGTHIYVANNDKVSCWDPIGFAAIGSGSRHAQSKFMLAGHSWGEPVPKTLLLTYTAKKNSEVAPGVGSETDMFLIERRLGSFLTIGREAIQKIDGIYTKIRKGEEKATAKGNLEINQYVEQLERQAATRAEQQTVPEIDGEPTPANGREVPDSFEERKIPDAAE